MNGMFTRTWRRGLRRVSMSQLVRHVDVVPEGDGQFIGQSVDLGWGRVYGGQTMAQGLAAAQQFVKSGHEVHQFGCQFLRGGDVSLPIVFDCDEIHRGRSFTSVHVRAMQNAKPILCMTASFQAPEVGMEHQMGGLDPEWRRPDDLASMVELMEPHLKHVPSKIRALYTEGGSPFDIRPTSFNSPWDVTVRTPSDAIWIRAKEELPDDLRVHQRLLTYASDWGLLATSLNPHPTALWAPDVRVASLSHSLHFHQPFRLDKQWLCHAFRSPASSGGRGYCIGEIWTEDGVLVASTAQEGLIRRISIPE